MAITTVDEVKKVAQIVNEFTDDEILAEIDLVEAELYQKFRLPKRSSFSVDNDYTRFYISTDAVHEIKRVQVSVTTDISKSGYLEIGSPTYYTFVVDNNYIDATGSLLTQYDNKLCRVQYIPRLLHLLATDITALNLMAQTTVVDGDDNLPPQVSRIKDRIMRYKRLLKPRRMILSGDYEDYDRYDYIGIDQVDFR